MYQVIMLWLFYWPWCHTGKIRQISHWPPCRPAHAYYQQLHKKLILPKILENRDSLTNSKGKHASNKWWVLPNINIPCAIESLRKVSGYPDVRIHRGRNVFTAWSCLKLPETSLHYDCTCLLGIKDDIRRAMKKGGNQSYVLTDFSKAFDTVCFETTIQKFYKLERPFWNCCWAAYWAKHNSYK